MNSSRTTVRQRPMASSHFGTLNGSTSTTTITTPKKLSTFHDGGDYITLIPSSSRLLDASQLPTWYAENPFLHTGYRPVLPSPQLCLSSWLYLHNQTVNILTHLLPGIVSLAANSVFSYFFSQRYPLAGAMDRAVFHVYLTALTLCFGMSAAYHTMLCHSRERADLWMRLDYVGISVLIGGSFVPGFYNGFYCEMGLFWTYIGMTVAMGLWNCYLSMKDVHGSKDWIKSRLLPFLAMGFSALIPIAHAAIIFPYEQLQKQAGLNWIYLEGACMVSGVLVLATQVPERWFPRTFDLFGASHQVFHCLVVLGTLCHWGGILSGFDWNYNNNRCASHL